MNGQRTIHTTLILVVSIGATALVGLAQPQTEPYRPLSANVIVPQWHGSSTGQGAVKTIGVDVSVEIRDRIAKTTMDVSIRNNSRTHQQAELLVPVPAGAEIRGFSDLGQRVDLTAEVLSQTRSRWTCDALVARLRDPSLLEFAGQRLVRTGVFQVAASGTQTVRLTYVEKLVADGPRVDYSLPRTELLQYDVPWKISVGIQSARPVSTVYSPSHAISSTRSSPSVVTAVVKPEARDEPGPFLLSYLRQTGPVTASLMAYPDAEAGGGYFMLLAGLRAPENSERAAQRREVTLVLDRSGSMSGIKLDQAKEAVRQVLEGLGANETFNLITYNHEIAPFSAAPISGFAASSMIAPYLDGITAAGNTNIYGALSAALKQQPTPGALPLVLLLTDGLATAGPTSEHAIRSVAAMHNPFNRRVYTFGVGTDVNAPLLEGIAEDSRGRTTFVLPGENIEQKVAQVFQDLSGPTLTEPMLTSSGVVMDKLPRRLPDLYEDDQLVVFGRYLGAVPQRFTLSGVIQGQRRSFALDFPQVMAHGHNSFVARIWATRRIAELTNQIRDFGVNPAQVAGDLHDNPALKKLVDEIVRLGTEFGILTEYTAFLARQESDLTNHGQVAEQATQNFVREAIGMRTGKQGVSRAINRKQRGEQRSMNRRNTYQDDDMNRVAQSQVQQIADRAFFRRGARWIDSRIVNDAGRQKPTQVVEFGTDAYHAYIRRLTHDGQQAVLALDGEILLLIDGDTVLFKSAKRLRSRK